MFDYKALGLFFLLLIACAVVACATTQAPQSLAVEAKTLLEQADSKGADEEAPAIFAKAKENLLKGDRAMQDKKYDLAKHMYERAIVDAELAMAKADQQFASQSAEELEQTIDTMQQEL